MKVAGTISGRDPRIANASFVCALLVVAIHLTNPPPDIIKFVLARVAVPFFFLVSGFFLARHVGEKGWWGRAIVKRLKTLGIPFFIWCAVPLVLFTLLIANCSADGECPRITLRFSSLAAAFGCHLLTLPEANRPLWYVRALFFLMLVSPAIVWAVRRFGWWAVGACGVVYWALNPGLHGAEGFWLGVRGQVFWKFVFSVEGLFYFAMGLCLALRPPRFPSTSNHNLQPLASTLIALAFGVAAVLVRARSEVASAYLASAAIPFLMVLLWSLVPARPWPKILAGNAFALYVIHPVVLKVLAEANLVPPGSAAWLTEWGAAVLLSLAIAALLRRALPKVAALAFGGR